MKKNKSVCGGVGGMVRALRVLWCSLGAILQRMSGRASLEKVATVSWLGGFREQCGWSWWGREWEEWGVIGCGKVWFLLWMGRGHIGPCWAEKWHDQMYWSSYTCRKIKLCCWYKELTTVTLQKKSPKRQTFSSSCSLLNSLHLGPAQWSPLQLKADI